MNNKTIKTKILFIIYNSFFIIIILLFPYQAYAENNINLNVSPALITIPSSSANPKVPITIENKGNTPEQIQIQLIPFHPSSKKDGQIEYLNPNTIPQSYKNIFEKIHLTYNGIITKNFSLGPKQKKELQLQFLIPKEESTSDYYFSIIFLTSPNPNPPKPCQNNSTNNNSLPAAPCSSAYSNLNAGIATNVLLSVGPKENPQGEIAEFSAPKFLQSGPVPFTVSIKNSGPHFFAPTGRILIKNVFGQTIGRIDLTPTNILSGTYREKKIIWPEKFLLGPYTATLNLALSEQGPVYNRSIYFIAMPIQMTIGIIITILILIAIILRIRHRLRIDK